MATGHQTKNPPSSTVYVRNLPYDITEDEVRTFFLPAGTPSRIAVGLGSGHNNHTTARHECSLSGFNNDRETGRFRGIAFVTFPSVDVAESVVRNLNAQGLKGRDIYLDFSRDRERRPGPPRGGQDGHHPMHPPDQHGQAGGAGNSGGYGGPPQMHHNSQPGGYAVPSAPPMQQYPGLVSAPPQGQPQAGPGHLMFQGNVPSFPGQGQMLQPIILSADGKVISGQAPPGGLVLQGHGAAPMGVPGVGAGAAMPGAPPAPQPALLPPQVMSGGGGGGMPPSAPPPPQQPRGVDGGMGAMQHAQAASAAAAAVPKEPSELKPDLPVGIATAQHASQRMANMLGAPQSASAPSQQTTSSALSGMSPNQLFRILRDLRALIQDNPDKGRAVLRENLPLTKALFQAQILLGMVNPDQKTLGEVWAQGNGSAAAPTGATAGHGVAQPNGAGEVGVPVATAAPVAAPVQQGGGMPPPPPQAVSEPEAGAAAANAVPAAQREMVRRVMALRPEQLADLTDAQRQQVEQVKAWALSNNVTE